MAQAAGWIRRLARYQLIGHLLPGRKVLELGCESGEAADELADRGAEVFGFEPTQERGWAEGDDLRGRARLGAGDPYRLHFAAEAFDVVLVPELTRWARRRQLLNEVRRVLRADGLALICARCDNDDSAADSDGAAGAGALSHPQLVRSLRAVFPHVRVYGDMPFFGRILADFAPPGPPEPELDCSLVDEDQAPTHLLALCAAEPVDPLGYVVVQLPVDEPDAEAPAEQLAAAPEPPVADAAWAEGLVAQLERQTARAEQERARADQEQAALARLEARVAELKAARAEDEWRIDELKGRALAAENALARERQRGSASPASGSAEEERLRDKVRRLETQLMGVSGALAELEQLRLEVRKRRGQDHELEALKSELQVTRRELSHARQSLQRLDTVENELREHDRPNPKVPTTKAKKTKKRR